MDGIKDLMVDFCRAIAVAALGDANAIRLERVSLTWRTIPGRWLRDIDVAAGMTTWSRISATLGQGAAFTMPTY